MDTKRKKKVGARPQKVNIRKEGTSASCGLEVGCAAKDTDARSLTAARPATPAAPVTAAFSEDGGRACGGIEIKVGYAAAAAAGISGDTAASCRLPGGSRALILSDGMGTGIKAAAGSRLVVRRLVKNLKAGMPVASAIKEVNRYMIKQAEAASLKHPDDMGCGPARRVGPDCSNEDFATVDLTVIDRQSRRAGFYKMGAATSFVMRQGRVRRIKSAALPVGIIPKLRLTHISAVLREGDIIVMVSDGITDADRNDPEARWLCDYLSETIYKKICCNGRLSARQLAADILAEAQTRYGDRERDDLTVAAALIVRAIQTVQKNGEQSFSNHQRT